MAAGNVHDRHSGPQDGEDFDTQNNKPEDQSTASKPKFSWPGGNKQQDVRDAHFYEDGVKADLTGGTPPEEQ